MESGAQFAVVTGASRGIGLALARHFAEAGFDELTGDLRSLEDAAALMRAIRGRGVDAIAINADAGVADVRCANATIHFAEEVVARMIERGSGEVLFTASAGAPKAFVYAFVEAVRSMLNGRGQTVSAMYPGPPGSNVVVALIWTVRRGVARPKAIGARTRRVRPWAASGYGRARR